MLYCFLLRSWGADYHYHFKPGNWNKTRCSHKSGWESTTLYYSVLKLFGSVFFFLQHPEFSFLLKERVCPLIIKLFSPSIKHRISSTPLEKPLYPVAVRLLRIVSVLIEKFYTLLVSCLIFIFNFIDFILVLKEQ